MYRIRTCLTTDWTTGVRSLAEIKDSSSSVYVHSSSEAHPASCPMSTGGPFPGVKRGRGVTLTTHPHLVPGSRVQGITLYPLVPAWRIAGQLTLISGEEINI
jgi:hypothetical protein